MHFVGAHINMVPNPPHQSNERAEPDPDTTVFFAVSGPGPRCRSMFESHFTFCRVSIGCFANDGFLGVAKKVMIGYVLGRDARN